LEDVHVSVEDPPPYDRVVGEAENVPVGAGGVVETVTVALYVVVPVALVSVRVYVLDASIVTLVDPLSATDPIPLSRDALVAPEDVQVRVEVPPPYGRLVGLAVSVPVGGAGAATVTVVL
jgi:hypothetical protein